MPAAVRHVGILKMPPSGKLTEAEIALIEKWIAVGAPGLREPVTSASGHWAFRPPQRPAEPR